jgi:hypothetical protein
MPRWIKVFVPCAVLFSSGVARAQIHADLELEAGTSLHVLTARQGPAGNPDPGPALSLAGHVAVLPLLRAGIYVLHDFSPTPGADLRELTSAGLSVRLYAPWPRGDLRLWFATGLGYAAAEAPSYVSPPELANSPGMATQVSSTSGGFFELPLGIGTSFRVSQRFELIAEAGARIGFGFTGSMYEDGPTATTSGSPPRPLPPAGEDRVTVFLVAGVALQL